MMIETQERVEESVKNSGNLNMKATATDEQQDVRFDGFYDALGEGVLAAFRCGANTLLYDRQGLQHRIVSRRESGFDTNVEERALAQMNVAMTPRLV